LCRRTWGGLVGQQLVNFKGYDSNFEVNNFSNFKSCYKWIIYLAFNNMYLDSAWKLL